MNSLKETIQKTFSKGPEISGENISQIGNTLIIAPHADDESLACGGVMALLRENGFDVQVLFITDGSMSHPNSKSHPSNKLRDLREEEALKALKLLGITDENVIFSRIKDSMVARQSQQSLSNFTNQFEKLILDFSPKTIFLPWRLDPHQDHKATWEMCSSVLKSMTDHKSFQILEYPVWFWERTTVSDILKEKNVDLWKVNIETVLPLKKKAVECHQSQLGKIINDDPGGFSLSQEMLQHFYQKEEYFFKRH